MSDNYTPLGPDEYKEAVLQIIIENPGIWTASICRKMNGLTESVEDIQYCGTCEDYANVRKRNRAKPLRLNLKLPGIKSDHAHTLHPACGFCRFTRLRKMLGRMDKSKDSEWSNQIISSKAMIPDTEQSRGWDLATAYWYYPPSSWCPDIEDDPTFWAILNNDIVDLREFHKKGGLIKDDDTRITVTQRKMF